MASIWDWLFGRKNSADEAPRIESPKAFVGASVPVVPNAPAPYQPTEAETLDTMREFIRREIAAGYLSKDEILEGAVDYLIDDADEAQLRPMAAGLWPELAAEHQAAQAEWPETTDYDRLNAAFESMEAKGIIARQNFTCCGSCGSAEIWDEVDVVRDAGGPARGYAFFHWQDTERAVDGEGLYLNYGACEEGEAAALEVAKEIVAELQAHELATDWNGQWNQRIGLTLDWKRRQDYAA